MATIIWTGIISASTYRVVDRGAANKPRLVVELQGPIDAMGTHGWITFDPLPQTVFEAMLLAAGVVV